MSISPKCDYCKKILTDFSGILLSPPNKESEVKKYHICKECYKKVSPKK